MSRPFSIGIGGAHSGVGKTGLASAIIRHLRHNPTKLVPVSNPLICAIKFTNSDTETLVISDPDELAVEGKDTARLSDAGADRVLWIRSSREKLPPLLQDAMRSLAGCDILVIEGNSAVETAGPGVIILIAGPDADEVKDSALRLLPRADILVRPAGSEAGWTAPARRIISLAEYPYSFDDAAAAAIIKEMENLNKDKKLETLLTERAADGRITCTAARALAEELGIAYKAVGDMANTLGIKIKNCELGCFR